MDSTSLKQALYSLGGLGGRVQGQGLSVICLCIVSGGAKQGKVGCGVRTWGFSEVGLVPCVCAKLLVVSGASGRPCGWVVWHMRQWVGPDNVPAGRHRDRLTTSEGTYTVPHCGAKIIDAL